MFPDCYIKVKAAKKALSRQYSALVRLEVGYTETNLHGQAYTRYACILVPRKELNDAVYRASGSHLVITGKPLLAILENPEYQNYSIAAGRTPNDKA